IPYATLHSLATALTPTARHAPPPLVKNLHPNRADILIAPLKCAEKGALNGFAFGVFQWPADGSSTLAK
ncbi:leucine ABC transporter subunit substrate-binding protein LivK, partial [Salmonella enterica]